MARKPTRLTPAQMADVIEWYSHWRISLTAKARQVGVSKPTLARMIRRLIDPDYDVRMKFRRMGIAYEPPAELAKSRL